MDALRKVSRAVVAGGLVVDLQPVGSSLPVETGSGVVGAIDASEWRRTIARLDRAAGRVLRDGLLVRERTLRFDVHEVFESPGHLIETAAGWRGTRVPRGLRARVRRAEPPYRVRQLLWLRALRVR